MSENEENIENAAAEDVTSETPKMPPEEEAMAAAMLADDGDDDEMDMMAAMMGDSESEPMDQAAIDAMLGMTSSEDEQSFNTVVEEMIHLSSRNFEKLPMLNVVFDRLIMNMASLKTHVNATVSAELKPFAYYSYQDAIQELPIPSILQIIRVKQWENNIICCLDAALIYAALELRSGGKSSEPARNEGRNFTGIEKRVCDSLTENIMLELSSAFEQVTDVQFIVERSETNPEYASITAEGNPCIFIQMSVQLDDRKGNAYFILPYATLEPVRKLLSKVFFGEKSKEKSFSDFLETELGTSKVNVEAVLTKKKCTLVDALSWKAGDIIPLDISSDSLVTICKHDIPIAAGNWGKLRNGKKAVRITETLYQDEVQS